MSQLSVFIVNIKFELADSLQILVFNIKNLEWRCLTYDFGSGPLFRGKLVFQSCKKSVKNIIIKKYEENHMCVNVSWLIFPLCCVSYELLYPWWLQSIWALYLFQFFGSPSSFTDAIPLVMPCVKGTLCKFPMGVVWTDFNNSQWYLCFNCPAIWSDFTLTQ